MFFGHAVSKTHAKVALDAAGKLAAKVLAHTAHPEPGFLVFGFAETATALGQAVAAALPDSTCVLSTRRPGVSTISFAEEHSHATDHPARSRRGTYAACAFRP